MFCCPGFENHVKQAGTRGLAILVNDTSGRLSFEFQSRGVAYKDEGKLPLSDKDLTINISASVGFRFCPWCGSDTDELLNVAREYLADVGKRHRKMLTLIV